MIISNTDYIAGKKIKETLGLVRGNIKPGDVVLGDRKSVV